MNGIALILLWHGLLGVDTAPDGFRLAVSLPAVFFTSATEKAAFLSALEASLDAVTANTVSAYFAEYDELATADIWLTDASDAYAVENTAVVKYATFKTEPTLAVGLYATNNKQTAHGLLAQGKRILIPGKNPVLRDLFRYTWLLDEPGSDLLAKRLEFSRDARAALSTVAAGEASAALVYQLNYTKLDPQLAGVKHVVDLATMPLPSLVINTKRISGGKLARLKTQLAKATLPTVKDIVDSWQPGANPNFSALKQALQNKKPLIDRQYILAPLPPLQIDLIPLVSEPERTSPLLPSLVMPRGKEEIFPDPPNDDLETPGRVKFENSTQNFADRAS